MWGQTFFGTKRPSPYLARLWRAQDGRQLRWLRNPLPSASIKNTVQNTEISMLNGVFILYLSLKKLSNNIIYHHKKVAPSQRRHNKRGQPQNLKRSFSFTRLMCPYWRIKSYHEITKFAIITPFFLCWNIFNVVIDLYLKIFYYLIIIQLIIIDRIFSLFTLLLQRKIFNHLIQFKRKYAIIFK